jgi:predicted RNase H-like HicB family nuclease
LNSPDPGYDVVITPDVVDGEDVYMAMHPALAGCMSHGATPEDAVLHLAEARALYLEALRSSRLPVPEPSGHPRVVTATVSRPEELPADSPRTWTVRVPGGNELEVPVLLRTRTAART